MEKPYADLAKLNAESHLGRMGYEWKLLLGLWGGMALTIWLLIDRHVQLPSDVISIWMILYFLLVAFVTFLAILPIQKAHEIDRQFQHYYMLRAEGENADRPKPGEVKWSFGFKRPWAWGQVLITGGLAIATFVVLCNMDRITLVTKGS